MGTDQREALARLVTQDEEFKAAMMSAVTVEDAVRIAGEYGITAAADDFTVPEDHELSETELDQATGGILDQIWPTTPWVAC